jgi:hypothetical protein
MIPASQILHIAESAQPILTQCLSYIKKLEPLLCDFQRSIKTGVVMRSMMPPISGRVTELLLIPPMGGVYPAGASVEILAKGDVTLEGKLPPSTSYRVTLSVRVFSARTCRIEFVNSSTLEYTTDVISRTHQLGEASRIVSGDGVYRGVAEVLSEEKNQDGSYQPAIVLATQNATFKIGNTAATLPSGRICIGQGQPEPECVAPSPMPGATAPLLSFVSLLAKIWTIGSTSSDRRYEFEYKTVRTRPVGDPSVLTRTEALQGVSQVLLRATLGPCQTAGRYGVSATLKAKQVFPQHDPNCLSEVVLDAFSYEFSV